jgi:uncharacterized protein YidB (DUF937 family)
MGLMDILNGMQNGPGGQRQPTPPGQGGGMSPWMMALLGLLAYKAIHRSGAPGAAPTPPAPPPRSGSGGGPVAEGKQDGGGSGGGLGDILGSIFGGGATGGAPRGLPGGTPGAGGGGLGGILGGLLGGAAAGSVLNGGLGQVLSDLQRAGHGDTAQSWVGSGPNEPIEPDDLGRALGADTVNQLSQQSGLPRGDLLQSLSENLPQLVNELTPQGRLPTDNEAKHW